MRIAAKRSGLLVHCLAEVTWAAGLGFIALTAVGCSSDSDGASSSGGSSSGGSSAGGSSAGGSSAGGSSAGGSSAGGSSAGGSSAGGGGGAAECADASDCTLFNDCCACVALAPSEAEPASACPLASCIQSHCDAIGAPTTPKCVTGRCVLDVNCDLSGVTCKRAEPECDPGSVPTAVGDCYGGCVLRSECSTPPAG